MGNNERYFYLSGLLSFSLFALFAVFFLLLLFKSSHATSYALKKDTFIAVNVVLNNTKQTHPKKQTATVQPKSTPNAENKNVDVNDLFSDVWTQKIDTTTKPKKVNSKRIQEIAKRIPTKKKSATSSLSEKLQDIQEVKSSTKQTTSSAQEVNEYLAKIQAIVYENFYPPVNSQGNVVRVVIELDPFGKMRDFRVLSYSGNEALNREVDSMKQRLVSVLFPKNPDNQQFRAIINLIPENKE